MGSPEDGRNVELGLGDAFRPQALVSSSLCMDPFARATEAWDAHLDFFVSSAQQ